VSDDGSLIPSRFVSWYIYYTKIVVWVGWVRQTPRQKLSMLWVWSIFRGALNK
jgi:hypothetical protein